MNTMDAHLREQCEYQLAHPWEYHTEHPKMVIGLLDRLEIAESVVAALVNHGGQLDHSYNCFLRTKAAGWKWGEPPVVRCVCGLDDLEAALERVVTA